MGKDVARVAIDSQALTYVLWAFHSEDEAPSEPCAAEKVALYRTFLYLPSESTFNITPTVKREYLRIGNAAWREAHEGFTNSLFTDVYPADPEAVEIHARKLSSFQDTENNLNDCRILAECELVGIKELLSYDKQFLTRLAPHAQGVRLWRPTAYWDSLNIPKGTKPNRVPRFDNPLSKAEWWRW